eukprot:scaffold9172_cov52-Phaeocystis_antarctica.AAC.1
MDDQHTIPRAPSFPQPGHMRRNLQTRPCGRYTRAHRACLLASSCGDRNSEDGLRFISLVAS